MDPSNEDHWNFLAENLGAEVKPEQPAAPPRAVAPASRPKPEPKHSTVNQPPRRPTNWSQLATTLGLEPVADEPPQAARTESSGTPAPPLRPPAPERATAPERTPSSERRSHSEGPATSSRQADRGDRSDRGRRPPRGQRRDSGRPDERPDAGRHPRRDEAAGHAPEIREPIFDDPDEPVDDLDRNFAVNEIIGAEVVEEFIAEPVSADDESHAAGDQGQAEPRRGGRKRRRRGRGRRGKSDRSGEPADRHNESAGSDELSADDSEFSDSDSAGDDLESSAAPLQSEADESTRRTDEERKGRSRRRRRRGSRDRKSSPSADSPDEFHHGESREDEGLDDDLDEATSAQAVLSAAASESEGEHADGDDDGDGSIDRHSHRGIPSWDEAMAYIIDANMEARVRSPKPSGPRGRRGGGRGRPSGRREREGERPSS